MGCVYLREERYLNFGEEGPDGNGKKGDWLKRVFLVAILVMVALVGFSQQQKKTFKCLKLDVHPTVDSKTAKQVTIKLLQDNKVIQTVTCNNRLGETFFLDKDKDYTVEISSPGRLTRRVSIFTHLPTGVPLYPMFKLDISVELPQLVPVADDFYHTFPVALVQYNKAKDVFEPNKKYTAWIKGRMEQMEKLPVEEPMATK